MTSGAPRMGPVGSRCGRPASRGGRVRPGLAGNGEVAARARAPQARVRARRRRPPSQGGHGFSGPHHWNGFSGPRCWRRPGAPAALHLGRPDHPLRREPAPRGRPAPGRPRAHWPPAQGRTQPARTVLVRRENGTCSSRERYLLAVRTDLPGLAHLAGGVIGTSLAPPHALRSCPHSAAGAAQRGCSRCRP